MENENIQFDARKALQVAVSIARPRRIGSQAEAQIGRDLAKFLEQAGYQVQAEPFRFTDAYSIFLLLEIITCQVLVILTFWLNSIGSPIQMVAAMLLLLLLGLINRLNRAVQQGSLVIEKCNPTVWARLCQRLGRTYRSINYSAKISNLPTKPGSPHLILMAHYDSKSQRLPLAARIALFFTGIAGAMLFAGLILLSPLMPELATPAQVVGGVVLLAGVPLWFLDLGDDSPGAIDNASSVGVVLELARALAKDPAISHKLNLTILLTSAEEVSTMGAVAFVQRHAEELRRWARSGRLYVLNFEGVGVDGSLRWVGKAKQTDAPSESSLLSLVCQACIDLDYELRSFNLPGALYDHLPFAASGLEAGTLMASSRASLSVHTRGDDIDQLDVRGFEQAGQVALRVILNLVGSRDPTSG
jgi:hypothetical protein